MEKKFLNPGRFVISIDFELHWGTFFLKRYNYKTLKQAREVVKLLLENFNKYEIHATWATVGMLCGLKEIYYLSLKTYRRFKNEYLAYNSR